ncbi:MAG TPA: helix-turn-helix domain-containing protein [Acidimicrobiales bacterium]|nr:helix-turn-helix domain-containing protein [Acidimicrobiales bacterium]
MVQETRRDRRHDARRSEFLAAARAVAEQDGLDALTIKGLARRLDCAVGTMYTYFPSKGALLAALQADAIERLAAVYDGAADRLEARIDGLGDEGRALARLVAFGRFIIVAERRMPEEFHLQQQLLAQAGVADTDHVDEVIPVAFALLARPQGLIEDGVARGVLAPGESFDRTVSWVAAVNGVLTLDGIQHPGAGLFDTGLLADRLTFDLLVGWGADRAALDGAADHVPLDRLEELFVP